jgi:hypothetical protein
MLERPTSKAARHREEMRRHRARARAGKMVVPVELGRAELDWLASPGVRWITPGEADQGDARVIGAAIARGLRISAGG